MSRDRAPQRPIRLLASHCITLSLLTPFQVLADRWARGSLDRPLRPSSASIASSCLPSAHQRRTSPMLKSLILFSLLLVSHAWGLFDNLTCTSYNECIVPRQTQFCYNPNQSQRSREDSICRYSNVQNIMAVHIASQTSIGYYDTQTLERLGDWSWNVIRSVYLCVSGQLTDGTYQSSCSRTRKNNEYGSFSCSVAIGQPFVADGCYTPDTSPAAVQVASSVGSGSPAPTRDSSSGPYPNIPQGSQGSHGSQRFEIAFVTALLMCLTIGLVVMN